MSVMSDAASANTRSAFRRLDVRAHDKGRHTWLARAALSLFLLSVIGGLAALGVWQLERRVWKLGLITRVEQRIHAPTVDAPGPAEWPNVTAESDEYRHVRASGHFLGDHETYVKAVTELGAGYWVMIPFRADRGFTVLVNRGFVPSDQLRPAGRLAEHIGAETVVAGLLRISEPKGGFLRANDPVHDRWYSRDVAAIAAARDLSGVAPYFIDAEAAPVPGSWPRAGLTVLAFSNNHLVYALTWFALALLLSGAVICAWSDRWRRSRTT